MKRSKPTVALLLFLPIVAFSQNVANPLKRTDSVYTVVEQQPEFPGGMAAMGQYLMKAIRYPNSFPRNQVQGRLFASFVVDRNGYTRDVLVTNGIKGTGNSSFEKEIAHVIQKMPRWKPGRNKGKPVSVRYNLPMQIEPE